MWWTLAYPDEQGRWIVDIYADDGNPRPQGWWPSRAAALWAAICLADAVNLGRHYRPVPWPTATM